MDNRQLNRSIHSRWLVSAARFGFVLLLLATTARAQIALHDGNPLTVTETASATINQSFTATAGASVMVVIVADYGNRLNEPATLTWGSQTLTRDVQTAYNNGNQRSTAIYHLFSPATGTAHNISGTVTGVSETWVTAYTLSGVDPTIPVISAGTNSGTGTGTIAYTNNLTGIPNGACAAVSAIFANINGLATISTNNGTGLTTATVLATNVENTEVYAGYVTNLSAGAVSLVATYLPGTGNTAQKGDFAVDVFSPSSPPIISTQPQSQTIFTNGNPQFSVSVTGSAPMSYQWYTNSTTAALSNGGNLAGATSNVLTILSATPANAGGYTVVITNLYGAVTSSVANLSFIPPSGAYEAAVMANSPAPFAFYTFSETNNPALGNLVAEDSSSGRFSGIYGVASSNAFDGIYGPQPIPDNLVGFPQGNTALFTVSNLPNSYVTLPAFNFNNGVGTNVLTITAWIKPQTVQAVNTGIVFCRGPSTISGLDYNSVNGHLGYTWNTDPNTYQWDSGIVPPTNIWSLIALVITPTNATVYMFNTNGFMAATHAYTNVFQQFEASTLIGWDSDSINRTFNGAIDEVALFRQALTQNQMTTLFSAASGIAVFPPAIVVNPTWAPATAYVGQTASIIVSPNGTAPLSYQWLAGAVGSGIYTNLANGGNISGATSATLTITNAQLANDLDYVVQVSNAYGVVTSTMPATLTVLAPGPATNFALNYGGNPIQENIGLDWNTADVWNPLGLPASTAVLANPGSSFEVVVGSRLRSPAGTISNVFPGASLVVDGDGIYEDGTVNGVGEIRFKNSAESATTNNFSNLVLNGGQLNIGDSTDVIFQGAVTVAANSVLYAQGNGTNQTFRIDSYLTGGGTMQLYLSNSTPAAALVITGDTNTFTGQWDIVQGPLVGSGANSLGTNTITIGAGGVLETAYPINNTNSSLVLNGQMYLTQTDTFNALFLNGTPMAAGTYSAGTLSAMYPANFPATFLAVYGCTATSASGQITVLTGVAPTNPVIVPVAPISLGKSFGIKFLGNTTDYVTGSAGVVPISGWTNIADATFTAGTIYSSDGSVSATLTRSGPGVADTWNSGAFSDGGNNSLMNGYQDARQNAPATDVISGLTNLAYDVYLYTGGDVARPSSGTDYLPNYTVNGTIYYIATLDGYDAILQMVQSIPISQNSSNYPTTLSAGQFLKISSVVPVGGAITISANLDNLTYRSPLNGIELVPVGNAPEIMAQPLAHRLYTGGVAQLQVAAEGASPLAYQWRQNGTNLNEGGMTSGSQSSSLTISNLVLTNAGNYDVVITNSYGSITSSVANLNVVVETTADAAFEAWVAAYVVTTNYQTAILYSLQTRHANNTLWQQAYMIWMVNDVYDCTHSPDQQRLINALINTFIHTQGTNFTSDSWDDDIEWGEIGLVRSYETTGNILALNTAIFNWNAVWQRGWNDVFGGGILEQIGYGSKDALSNYPEIIAGMHLYKITGQTNYFTICQTIYNWAWTNLFIATPAQATNGMNVGQVNEGVDYADGTTQTGEKVLVSDNSYNSGLFAMAAILFYETTGNTQYLSDAILAANQKINQEPILDESTFGEEILVRGAAMIASQNNYNLWPTYGPWLQNNAAAAWAMRRTDYNLTWDNFTEPTPGTTNNLDADVAECAVLVQQMAQAWIPGYATNFTLNYGGAPIAESAGNDWNNGNIWNPYGLSAASAAPGYPGSSFEVVAGSLVRNPAGSTDNAFPGATLQIDGNGNTDFNASPVGVGEIRFKNSTPGIPSTNYFNNLILNGGELNIGDSTDVILQGQITVQTNSVFGTQGGTGTNQTYQVDAYLTGSGTIVLYLTNSTPSASLNITGTTNSFTGQWNILQGPLVGSGANSLGTNTITVGTSGIVETTYPINNPNSSLVLNGRIFLTQTDAFNSVVINGTPLPAGTYTAAQLNATNASAFPLTFIALYGTTATSASGAITVGNVVVAPSSPRITRIQVSGTGGLRLSVTNGTPDGSWTLLQSTNLALPVNQWQTNATGTFDGSGNLSTNFLNTATNTQDFYMLKVQ